MLGCLPGIRYSMPAGPGFWCCVRLGRRRSSSDFGRRPSGTLRTHHVAIDVAQHWPARKRSMTSTQAFQSRLVGETLGGLRAYYTTSEPFLHQDDPVTEHSECTRQRSVHTAFTETRSRCVGSVASVTSAPSVASVCVVVIAALLSWPHLHQARTYVCLSGLYGRVVHKGAPDRPSRGREGQEGQRATGSACGPLNPSLCTGAYAAQDFLNEGYSTT
jgi:hypothetical protein